VLIDVKPLIFANCGKAQGQIVMLALRRPFKQVYPSLITISKALFQEISLIAKEGTAGRGRTARHAGDLVVMQN
jgi:hypothetical protein